MNTPMTIFLIVICFLSIVWICCTTAASFLKKEEPIQHAVTLTIVGMFVLGMVWAGWLFVRWKTGT